MVLASCRPVLLCAAVGLLASVGYSAAATGADTGAAYDGLAKISGSLHFLSTHLLDWVHPSHHDEVAVRARVQEYKELLMTQTGKLYVRA